MDSIISNKIISEGIDPEMYYIAVIDGLKCRSIGSFFKEIGKAFKFPDYYSHILNSLDEIINDLEWIDKPNYVLVIIKSDYFLVDETEETKNRIFAFLDDVSKEWTNVPNYEGEELFRGKADFRVILT